MHLLVFLWQCTNNYVASQVDWSEDRFMDIVSKLKLFLKQAGFRVRKVTNFVRI